MPLYEFACEDCGPFSAWRSMSESSQPAPCPTCDASAQRILSATAGTRGSRPRRGIPEPKLVRSQPRDPVKDKSGGGPLKQTGPAHNHGRPWMMGH